jgi:hypothetical protein
MLNVEKFSYLSAALAGQSFDLYEASANENTSKAEGQAANTAAPTIYRTTRSLEWDLGPYAVAPKDSEKMSDITREEIKAEIAASAARGETKIARFEGKLDLVLAKLDSVNTSVSDKINDVKDDVRSARANQWVIAFGLAVLIVAVAGLFPVFFGMGTQIRDMVHTEVQSQAPSAPPTKRPQ